MPVYATTQNREKLGSTCSELMPYLQGSSTSSSDTPGQAVEHVDKTAFSMWVPQIAEHFLASSVGAAAKGDAAKGDAHEIAIVGIETHVCVTQTALDLLDHGHKVYVIADGVSSCNPHEVPVALQRLRTQGAIVTTSESWLFEVMGDASISEVEREDEIESRSSLPRADDHDDYGERS
ncbi:MAG: hypothetical protein M1815_001490 [Lichina confinis]|nr:MAG: hypothetical protein M1815_001490 [Lichina confinis]